MTPGREGRMGFRRRSQRVRASVVNKTDASVLVPFVQETTVPDALYPASFLFRRSPFSFRIRTSVRLPV